MPSKLVTVRYKKSLADEMDVIIETGLYSSKPELILDSIRRQYENIISLEPKQVGELLGSISIEMGRMKLLYDEREGKWLQTTIHVPEKMYSVIMVFLDCISKNFIDFVKYSVATRMYLLDLFCVKDVDQIIHKIENEREDFNKHISIGKERTKQHNKSLLRKVALNNFGED